MHWILSLATTVLLAAISSGEEACSCSKEKKDLTIAAFNVQVFGRTKARKPDVIPNLVKIFKGYDIGLFQEIRDSSNSAIWQFFRELNREGDDFGMVTSSRGGKSSSKEQYAYVYRKSRCSVVATYDYEDPDDVYQRPPYVAQFQCKDAGVEKFVLAGVHTEPSSAEREIDNLIPVYDGIVEKLNIQDVLLLGDFNGDCSYFNVGERKKSKLKNDSRFKWLIDDEADTTTKSSNCAYDRFVTAGTLLTPKLVNARVQRFDTELGLSERLTTTISDHYPIVVTLSASAVPEEEPTLFPSTEGESGGNPSEGILVAAYNVQVFGRTKFKKPGVLPSLVESFKHWDIALFQEIRDSSQTAFPSFMDALNAATGNAFDYVIGKRQGRTSSKEQYAFIIRKSKCSITDNYDYNDVKSHFQRPPHVAKFRCSGTSVEEFAIAGIHTDPGEAETEIDALEEVYDEMRAKWNINEIILMGDFNADCGYFNVGERKESKMRNDPRFKWLIGDEMDTTTSATHCAYDRVLVSGPKLWEHAKDPQVDRFDVKQGLDVKAAKLVSDHYPVTFRIV